jgi:hypothetical protein
MTIIAVLIYNLCVLAGTAYLVALHDWSPWWFLFALMILLQWERKETKENDKL